MPRHRLQARYIVSRPIHTNAACRLQNLASFFSHIIHADNQAPAKDVRTGGVAF